jgi:hypothetical protein
MPSNVLFTLINETVFGKSVLPAKVKLSQRATKEGKEYFFFELPVDGVTVIGDYTLQNHHLSVFPSPLTPSDKSEHHYSAFFVDKDGREYRLHIYFNAKDYYVWEPQFCIRDSVSTQFRVINTNDHDEAFKLLADLATKSLIAHLRLAQKTTITKLDAECADLETRATELSKDIAKNRKEYLATIDRQIQFLEELKKYSYNPKTIAAKIGLLDKTYEQFSISQTDGDSLGLTASAKDYVPSSKPEHKASKPEHKATKPEHKASKPEHKASSLSLASKPTLADSVEDINKSLMKYKTATEDQKPDILAALLTDLLALEIENDDCSELNLLRSQIEDLGKGLLEGLLITGKYDNASKLNGFYPLLTENIFNLAIKRSETNTGLLEFLLKNKIIPSNYKNFSINGVTYSSLVEYYFESDIPNKDKLNCLGKLIQNGVSLLGIDKTGLPYAAILIAQPSHPLRLVLENNPELTLNNPLFYKQLINVLSVLASQPECSNEKKAQLNQLIHSNTISLEILNQRKLISKLGHIPLSKQVTTPPESSNAKELLAKLEKEPAIIDLSKRIEQRTTTLLKQVSLKLRKGIAEQSLDRLETYKTALLEAEVSKLPTYTKLKEQYHTLQKTVMEYLDLRYDLLTFRSNRGASNKQCKSNGKALKDTFDKLDKVIVKLYEPLKFLRDSKIEDCKVESERLAQNVARLELEMAEGKVKLEALEKARAEDKVKLEALKQAREASGFFSSKLEHEGTETESVAKAIGSVSESVF